MCYDLTRIISLKFTDEILPIDLVVAMACSIFLVVVVVVVVVAEKCIIYSIMISFTKFKF